MTPRILVTGFSAFPGAPVNPSEVLIGMLERDRANPGVAIDLFTRVLPVEYEPLPGLLRRFGAQIRPDIAIHFGLAETAKGFRLERMARNRSSLRTKDAAGCMPVTREIGAGPRATPSTLPLDAIAEALRARGLPVERSSDAGSYLCNHLFYHSCAGLVEDFRPAMAGFVHVPFLDTQLDALPPARASRLSSLTADDLRRGAVEIIRQCARSFEVSGRSARGPAEGVDPEIVR